MKKAGITNIPEIDGKKQYGRVVMYIPITEQGTLHMGDGGPRIQQFSDNAWLDQYLLQIIRKAGPFPPFHHSGMAPGYQGVRVLLMEFNFSK